MGLFRLYLACAVALAHGGLERHFTFPFFSLVSAADAVRIFFVVSGFYMALVLDTKYSRMPNGVWLFYGNRLLRLLPAYWLIALVFVAGSYIVHPNALTANVGWWDPAKRFLEEHPTAFVYLVLTNLLLIGQDFAAFITVVDGLRAHEFLIVPQAWSLGTELWFYAAAPFLVRLRSSALSLLIAIGVAIRLGVDFSFSVPDEAWPWNQRFLLAEYVYFLAGILAYRAMKGYAGIGSTGWANGIAVLIASAFVFYIGWLDYGFYYIGWPDYWRQADLFSDLSTAAIAALMIPTLFSLTKHSKLDRLAGHFSYPFYLGHVGVIYLFPGVKGDLPLFVLVTLALSAVVVFFVDLPLDSWRHRRTQQLASRSGPGLKVRSTT
jgi:peptidoglycan/LPS O-acetylase OafA/YrhL